MEFYDQTTCAVIGSRFDIVMLIIFLSACPICLTISKVVKTHLVAACTDVMCGHILLLYNQLAESLNDGCFITFGLRFSPNTGIINQSVWIFYYTSRIRKVKIISVTTE